MWINVIDYRGDDTIINSRGDNLFWYRTKYFLRIQDDFHYWKAQGHKFRCFTKHNDTENMSKFDDIVTMPPGITPDSRNFILNYYQSSTDNWLAIWENDATLYWNKLRTSEVPRDLDLICQQAEEQDIYAWVPFNAQQAPYPKSVLEGWTFKNTLSMKGTMIYIQNPNRYNNQRFDNQLIFLDDLEWAVNLTKNNRKVGMLEQCSLREVVNGKSTIFKVNAYHEEYKNPGPNANPKGLLKWDAQISRNEKYIIGKKYIEDKYKLSMKEISVKQKSLWIKNNFNNLFELED
jgi:hypothetical protein